MISKATLRLVAAACFLAMPLAFPGTAGADRLKPYMTDGTKDLGSGLYSNPNDGICVVGVKLDGTLDVNPYIDNQKDCIVYTTPTIKALAQTACLGGAGSDGYRHAWSTSICVDNATSKNPISRANLDNTTGMCTSKGGVVYTGGLCVAHSWQWQNVKAGETMPYRSTINPVPAGYKGRASADNLGFCYTAMRTTSAGYANSATCPSAINSQFVCAGGTNAGRSCTVATQTADCLASTCIQNPAWALGTDGVAYQSQAQYDAGLGWSFSSNTCLYAYGTTGYVNAALTKADNSTVAANTYVDLTPFTTQGDCLANGGTWDNWIPTLGGVAPGAVTQSVTTTPNATTIMKLDSLTPLASGGGQFYSGTGSVCTKCHTDQSRQSMERYKPGFVETPHKLAGDTIPGNWDPSSDWGIKGVQCTICHATGKPGQQDVGLIVYPNTTGPNAGLPRAASGHNQTEYGSHVTGVCYGCHGTAAVPSTTNPAAVIPVASGDFAPTPKGLAPIVNQFLNSPHSKYTGDSQTVSVITKTNYASSFLGYICRATGFGNGTILTTNYRSGVAGRIPNLDTLANAACTNVGDGSATSGAATTPGVAAFWVKDGEPLQTANGISVVDSAQGNCMTCHDVHWKLGSTLPDAEPIRRECTTCHSHPSGEASVTNAPQVNVSIVNHPGGLGTPLANLATEPNEACEICHMPKSSASGSPMHLWRVNTSASYATMGATQANTAADGTYANAAWVDLDFSCGQCHGGSGGSGATHNGAPYITKAALATYAAGIHNNKPTAAFTGLASGLTFNVDASASLCGGNLTNCDSFAFAWGDGLTSSKAKPTATPWLNTHTYTTAGAKTVTLTVSYLGVTATATKSISLTDTTPAAIGGVCVFDPNTWIASVTDSATTVGSGKTVAKVIVNWGDGTPYGITTTFPVTTPITHTYLNTGSFTVKEQVLDNLGGSTTKTLTCTPAVTTAYFTISGTVTQSNGTTPIASAVVKVMKGTTVVKSLFTSGTGNYLATSLKPGTYTIVASKTGVVFGNPAPTATVGTSKSGINISSTNP